ncbi:MAG: hypothetical protein GY778_25905 [bacterium]|nr:hypothetical protein [bacterium]
MVALQRQAVFWRRHLFYNGEEIQRLTLNTKLTAEDYSDVSQNINDRDEIVWSQRDYCRNPPDGEIMRFADGAFTQLTADQFQPQQADINNLGQVVWTYDHGLGSEDDWIELWEEGTTSVVTDWGINPKLNDRGDISFLRWHDDINRWQAWLYRGGDFYRLAPDPTFSDTDTDINNDGEVVMQSGLVPPGDILLMRRVRNGDYDFDGHVDLDDHASLAGCLTGPAYTGRVCACRFLDFDEDADIDLQDFAHFQTAFAGP